MIIYNMYSEMLFLNIVRNCTHLFVKQTNKKENYFFLWPLLKIQRSFFAQEVESIRQLLTDTLYKAIYIIIWTCNMYYIINKSLSS